MLTLALTSIVLIAAGAAVVAHSGLPLIVAGALLAFVTLWLTRDY